MRVPCIIVLLPDAVARNTAFLERQTPDQTSFNAAAKRCSLPRTHARTTFLDIEQCDVLQHRNGRRAHDLFSARSLRCDCAAVRHVVQPDAAYAKTTSPDRPYSFYNSRTDRQFNWFRFSDAVDVPCARICCLCITITYVSRIADEDRRPKIPVGTWHTTRRVDDGM